MSGTRSVASSQPRLPRSIQPTAGGDSRVTTQGMVSPREFVFPDSGDLTPVAFRFLNSLFIALAPLPPTLAALEQQVTAQQAQRIADLETRVAALEARSP